MFDVDPWVLALGLIFSAIGLGYFRYGKKQGHSVAKYFGVALMVYPYFVSEKYTLLGVGIVLMLIPAFLGSVD